MNPRLSLAFALVSLGSLDYSEFSALRYLVNTLNSRNYRGVAFPFLVELARESQVRAALYPALARATKDEKIALAGVLGRSGDQTTVSHLEAMAKDTDPQVAQEAVEALRTLRTKLK